MSTPETDLLTTGMLFVRGWPTVGHAKDGAFQITIPCMASYSGGVKTRWTVIYSGPEAAAFWLAHKPAIKPGRGLQVVLHRETVHNGEITSLAQTITLAPLPAQCAQPLAA